MKSEKMENAVRKTNMSVPRPTKSIKFGRFILNAMIWMSSCFTLTEMDRYKAGINTGGEGRNGSPHK